MKDLKSYCHVCKENSIRNSRDGEGRIWIPTWTLCVKSNSALPVSQNSFLQVFMFAFVPYGAFVRWCAFILSSVCSSVEAGRFCLPTL